METAQQGAVDWSIDIDTLMGIVPGLDFDFAAFNEAPEATDTRPENNTSAENDIQWQAHQMRGIISNA